MTPEDRDIKRILLKLKEYPGWWHKTPRSRYTTSGTPDILGCFFGLTVAVEVKRFDMVGGYGVTPTQQRTLDAITAAGGWSFVVNNDVSYQNFLHHLGTAWRLKDPTGWATYVLR